MISKNLPSVYILLKRKIKTNHIVKAPENIFFAFTSKAVEDVVINKYSSFIKDGGFKRLKYVLNEGLLTGDGPKHIKNKKEISPAFANSKIKEYENKVSAIIDPIISTWHDDVNVRKEMGFFVFKSVMEIFFSENMDDQFENIQKNIHMASEKIADDKMDYLLSRSTKELKALGESIVNKRLDSKENKNDLIDMLIRSYQNETMDLQEVYDETLTIFLTSYESTLYVLEWAIYYLAKSKEWQEKISNEEHVDAFINEVLRMCPSIWNSERLAIEDVTIDGIDITAGTKVVVSSLAMHRDKDVFENPDLFNPERWIENKDLAKGEYFPFLFGKRQCIGKEFALMEIKTVLVKVSKKFNLEPITDKVSHAGGLTFRPDVPIMVHVTNR